MNFDGPISNFNNILSEMSHDVYDAFLSSIIALVSSIFLYTKVHINHCNLSLESLMHILINLIP